MAGMRGQDLLILRSAAMLDSGWDFVNGAKSAGQFAGRGVHVEQTHEETQRPTPENRQEAQTRQAHQPVQIDELVPGCRAGDRHQPRHAPVTRDR
jgi:hypothetical protein